MANDDNDDIFEDFETKVKGESKRSEFAEKELSEEELLKKKYREAERTLKEKHKKEKEALEKKRAEEMLKHGKVPTKKLDSIERIAYIAIIAVLVLYIIIDLSFYHGKNADAESEKPIAVTVGEEDNKTTETEKIEEKAEEKSPEEEKASEGAKQLSGKITLTIDNIYKNVAEDLNDTGYITNIVFTIDNDKDKVLTPVVNVYAYDSELDESWETRSRGQYTYSIGIKPGDKHTGSIDLVPKTWTNLNVEKNIRLTLNDTKSGFITAVNQKVIIS